MPLASLSLREREEGKEREERADKKGEGERMNTRVLECYDVGPDAFQTTLTGTPEPLPWGQQLPSWLSAQVVCRAHH